MSLGVLNNLSAVYAENNLNNTNNSLSKTVLQQLSSGSKINSGADDAAGLSLVNGLQANQQALTQSQTNATEGVGLLQVADGALSQVTSLLNRAVTLATEASNGTLNSISGRGRQPGVPVDPFGNQQHRLHDHLQPAPGFRQQQEDLYRRLVNAWSFSEQPEHHLAEHDLRCGQCKWNDELQHRPERVYRSGIWRECW